MPGDICNHCNKKCTKKGKGSEAIQCDICFVWVYMLPVKASLKISLNCFQIFQNLSQILHIVVN